jgi:uncharacterized protein DUF4277
LAGSIWQVTLARHLPAGDARTTLPAATAIGVLVCNLCVAREPLYGLAGWAAGFEPALLGLVEGEAGLLNDDRVGRALDQLFDADRSSLLCELVLRAVRVRDPLLAATQRFHVAGAAR